MIFSSGGKDITFSDMKVYLIGMPWFFVALFFGRTIFDYIHLKINNDGILMIISSIVGMMGILWAIDENQYYISIKRIVVDIIIFFLFMLGNTIIQKFFQQKYCQNN